MSDKLDTINIRIDSETKTTFKQYCKELGMSTSQAITMFMFAFNRSKGFPFEIKIPNDTTLNAIRELESGTLSPTSKSEMEKLLGGDIS